MALALNYRPKKFSEVVGQEVVTKTLKNRIRNNNVHHAYLFYGPKGSGKTSCARILAKALNCSNIQDGEPCGICSSCSATNNFDIIELDAAQNNSVDDIRQLIARLMNAPIGGKYIVVTLDEIQMLTSSAANCLLKTLEEPPANVVFILCTTEEGKVIPTIQSRCQRYAFKPGNPKEIREVILNVCEQENITIDDRSISSLTQLSEGSYRNAISLLDKVAAYSGSNISFSETQTILGIPDSVEINNLLSASLSGNYYEIVKIMNTLEESGCDMKDVLNSLLEKLRIIDYSECGVLESKTANEFSKKYSKKLRRYLHQLLIECQRYFTFTIDKRDSLEFSLISMADVVMDIVND
jgi:DNA polymerase-3 subunit gamma/tau